MRIEVIAHIIDEYQKIRQELQPLLDQMGFRGLTINIRQRTRAEDLEWLCQEIGYDAHDKVFWAVYHAEVAGSEGRTLKQFKAYLDVESIEAITFETFIDPPSRDGVPEQDESQDDR